MPISKERKKRIIEKSVGVIASFSDIPRAALDDDQRLALVKARSNIYKGGRSVLKTVLGSTVNSVAVTSAKVGPYEIDWATKTIPKLDKLLRNTKAPEIVADSSESLEAAMTIIYQHLGSIEGAITVITPSAEYLKWLETHCKHLVKAMISSTLDWRGNALAEWWVPRELPEKAEITRRYANRLETRYKHLNLSYEIASRLLTIIIDAPTGSANFANRSRRKEERKNKH